MIILSILSSSNMLDTFRRWLHISHISLPQFWYFYGWHGFWGTEYNLFFTELMGNQIQFNSVVQLCLTLCDPMNRSMPGLPVHHQFPESTQIHVHWVGDAVQPSHLSSSPSLPALNLSQNQDLFKWVSSLHQVAKILEFQLQHQSFQWTLRTDLL